jgi:hypothetical protein
MSGVVFQVRERSRGNVTSSMMLWATAMSVVFFLYEAHWGSRAAVVWSGLGVSALFAIILGWRRRSAAIFVAPFVSWMFAWFPLWVAAMIHYGFFGGLFRGLFLVTIGWVVIGTAEFVYLAIFTSLVRLVRGRGTSNPKVVVFGPDDK